MAIWLALLAAPALALADQVIAYATVGWACAHDRIVVTHAVHLLVLLVTAASVLPAWRLWSATRGGRDEARVRRHFLAGIAVASGALSALVVATMWYPTWIIAPCAA
jgi:hypothetical protein